MSCYIMTVTGEEIMTTANTGLCYHICNRFAKHDFYALTISMLVFDTVMVFWNWKWLIVKGAIFRCAKKSRDKATQKVISCEFIGVKMYLPLLLLVVVGSTHGCMPKDSQQRYAQNLG